MTQIDTLCPTPPHYQIPWEAWENTPFKRHIEAMRSTPQNPAWHGEGDVWTHTKLVCEALVKEEAYTRLSQRKQQILFVAALMHDIAKPKCTVIEEGVITSPKHTIVGAKMARECLWRDFGLCGTKEDISFRETVTTLVRYHGMPLHLGDRSDPERNLVEVASMACLAPDFSLSLLDILVRADIRGRVASDTEEQLERALYARLMAEEIGIFEAPYVFPDAVTQHAYLTGDTAARDYAVYDDTWQEVIMLSGLPGVGKDTWIRTHYPHLSVVSLDVLRQQLRIPPTDKEGQGIVVSHAKDLAKMYLRERRPFIWNATDLTPQIRGSLVSLFQKYHAFVRIVYLETPLATELDRNRNRAAEVPERVIFDMLAKTELPCVREAHAVVWDIT